jgi:hypothetical protein
MSMKFKVQIYQHEKIICHEQASIDISKKKNKTPRISDNRTI